MKKKGFTLVELLAVIIILAVIALIATPLILNTIDDVRVGAAKVSTVSYVKAIELKVASNSIDDKMYADKDDYVYNEIGVDVKGTTPTGGIYSLKDGVVTVGTFCIDGYEVKYTDGNATVTGKCTGEDLKLSGLVELSEYFGQYIYPTSGTFTITKNISGGNLRCVSSDEEVATCSITETTVTVWPGEKEGSATLTITSEATSKYKEAQAAYVITTGKGLLSVTAAGYNGTYDGKAHGITVSSDDAIIRYGLIEGIYDLEQNPTYTDVGEYTVYYEISKQGYKTVTGSKNVVITKAEGKIELVSTKGTVEYNKTQTIEISNNISGGEIVAVAEDTNVVDVSVADNKVSITGKQTGTTTVEVTSLGTNNYNNASAVYAVTVSKTNNELILSENSGNYTYPTEGTFTVIKNASGGKLSCETDQASVATCKVSGTTVTVIPGETEGSATLTIKSEATTNYNAAQVAYVAITKKGTLSDYTASGYSGTYDGLAHGITVSASGSTIKYGTDQGSYTLTSSPTYTDVGEYTIYYEITKPGYGTITGSKMVIITKASGTVAAPTAKSLTYTGNTQILINEGSSSTGTIQYKLEGGEYSTNIPTGINAGKYIVYYRVLGDKNHENVEEKSILVTINEAKLNYSSIGYNETYDGMPHGITVTSDGATIKYGTDQGSYTLTSSPTYTDVGTYNVYYQITREGYTTVTGNEQIIINKANNTLTLSENSGSYTYPTTGTFTVTKNTSGGALTCETNKAAVATCTMNGTTVTVTPGTTVGSATLTIKSAATTNYNAAQAAYVVTTAAGTQSVTASGYSGTYDGLAHGITVSASGATIKYGTNAGSYTLTSSPTYTDAGTYTVHYQVTRTGYTTVTGSKQVVISKATNPISVTAKSLTYTGSAQALVTVSGAQGNVCYSTSSAPTSCTSAGAIPTGTNAGSYTVYYYVAGNTNYEAKSGNVKVTIAKKADAISITAKTGTYNGSGQTATFSATSGLTPTVTYYSDASCATAVSGSPVNVGTYYAKATTAGNTNYNAGSLSCTKAVTINKANNTLTLSENSGSYTYPTTGTFTVTKNTSGGALTCETNKAAVATCTMNGTTVTVTPGTTVGSATLTIKSAATTNYNAAQAAYVVTTAAGTQSVTASGYSGTYDGLAHGITVSASGATIKYGTNAGSYTLTSSPTYTDAGTYTVHYQVTRTGYTTVTGSKQVVISKAAGSATLSATSGSIDVGATKTFTVSGATGTLTCTSSNTSIATCSISSGTVTVTGVKDGSATITINVAESTNYNATSKTYAATINVIPPKIVITSTPASAQNGYYKQQVATVTFNKSNLSSAYYYFKSERAAKISKAVTQSCGTGSQPTAVDSCTTITSTTNLAANTWYRVSTTVDITYNVNATSTANIYATTYSGTTKKAETTKVIGKIDSVSPTVTISSVTPGSNNIKIAYTLSDSGSGVGSYTCKYLNATSASVSAEDATYTTAATTVTSTNCELSGLKEGTKYYYQVCATDKVGNESTCKTGTSTTTSLVPTGLVIKKRTQTSYCSGGEEFDAYSNTSADGNVIIQIYAANATSYQICTSSTGGCTTIARVEGACATWGKTGGSKVGQASYDADLGYRWAKACNDNGCTEPKQFYIR